MEEYRYDFSVVMAVYNVEEYLQEAVESLVHQTIGFSHIQLIMVDDGSTDGSGKICDEYKKKYPKNVVVIHKENGGVCSARNTGLKYAEGRYINFMDSDDKFSRNSFKSVYDFFVCHDRETDICTLPVFYFDAWSTEHYLNGKFKNGNRVIDLKNEPDASVLNVNASFFTHRMKDSVAFDSHLVTSEDIKYVLEVLLYKQYLGVVSTGKYLYRKRQGDDSGSLVQSGRKKRAWYEDYFTYLFDWAFNKYKADFGTVPLFVHYILMCDLQWRFVGTNDAVMKSTLVENRSIERYKQKLWDSVSIINPSCIMDMKMLSKELKYKILSDRLNVYTQLIKSENDIEIGVSGITVSSMSDMLTILEFLVVEDDILTIEGYHVIFGIDVRRVQPYMLINGSLTQCEHIMRNKRGKCLGEKISDILGFRLKAKVKKTPVILYPYIVVDDIAIQRHRIGYGKFFPISSTYKHMYATCGKYMVSVDDAALRVDKVPGLLTRIGKEAQLIYEIWSKNYLGGRKAVAGRLFYHLVMLGKKKKIWIISDRIAKADDNGEALFCYLADHPLSDVDVYFSISKTSTDYERLSKIGKCLDAMSFKHKLCHIICDVNISSQADNVTVNPFEGHHEALRDLLCHQKFVFLQHGIIHNDLSDWLNKYNKNISGFVTSTKAEYKSIVKGNYYYDSEKVWLTGLPRYDLLENEEKRIITIMPTWRRYLVGNIDGKTGQWSPIVNFKGSEFFKKYNAVLNSEELLSKLEAKGYKLQFFLHPIISMYIGNFHRDERVRFLPLETSYRQVFKESSLIVTDYSSAIFDFAYLRKPLIYFQFDKYDFENSHTNNPGYFDYEQDGFGEVVFEPNELISLISDYVDKDCKMKKDFIDRVDRFFCYNDRNCCERVIDRLLMLDGD